jgi:hypothetical protein
MGIGKEALIPERDPGTKELEQIDNRLKPGINAWVNDTILFWCQAPFTSEEMVPDTKIIIIEAISR